jgi:hypothetical protein
MSATEITEKTTSPRFCWSQVKGSIRGAPVGPGGRYLDPAPTAHAFPAGEALISYSAGRGRASPTPSGTAGTASARARPFRESRRMTRVICPSRRASASW